MWYCIIIFLLNSAFQNLLFTCSCFISHLFSTSYSQEFQPNVLCLLISRSSINFQEISTSGLLPLLVEIFWVDSLSPQVCFLFSFFLLFIKEWGVRFKLACADYAPISLGSNGITIHAAGPVLRISVVRIAHQTRRKRQGWFRHLHRELVWGITTQFGRTSAQG